MLGGHSLAAMLAQAVAVGRYLGPPPLTMLAVLTSWRAQPAVLATVAVLGGAYGCGVVRLRHAGRTWPRSRLMCFAAGVVSIALVGLSFLGVYDDTLFWARAVQNVLLLMVTPMLLALGAPITLAGNLMPAPWRRPLSRVLHSRAARACTFPLALTLVLVLPLPLLYFTPLYLLTLRNPAASGLSALVVTLAGFVYFWTRFRVDPTPRQDSYGLTLVITIVEQIGDAVLGVVLWLGPLIAAGYYAAVNRDWGPSLRTDQLLGAGVLWVGGDVIGLPFIAVIFKRMVREDEDRAAAIDRELDAAEDAAGQSPPQASVTEATAHPTATPAGPAQPPRLWWEDHPELSERFHRR
jgi:cytochrome c oxidase assembly factor CtaG